MSACSSRIGTPKSFSKFALTALLVVGVILGAQADTSKTPNAAPPETNLARLSGGFGKTTVPSHPQIAALEEQLTRLRFLDQSGGWPKVTSKQTLKLGVIEPAVLALRRRLTISGDLPRHIGPSSRYYDQIFDLPLQAAVEHFQERHGIEVDGEVGKQTWRTLNVPIAARIEQITMNIARWHRLPIELGKDYLMVNIPEYQLRLFENAAQRLSMRVVVGKRKNQTPELVEEMEHVVFNPYWYVPKKITTREILPKVQADPNYFHKKNFQAMQAGQVVDPATIAWNSFGAADFPYRIRQQPGPKNSLGSVKFIFPNQRSIYLHDTPSKALFDTSRRAYSHGCVRVEYPDQLAKAVLAMQNSLSEEEVTALFARKKTQRVNLHAPMPVYFTYMTASVENGQLRFFEDVYKRDMKQLRQLRESSDPTAAQPKQILATVQ